MGGGARATAPSAAAAPRRTTQAGAPSAGGGSVADTENAPRAGAGAPLRAALAVLNTTGSFYQVLVAVLRERLLLLVLVLGPAVGDHVVHDGRVVDGLRLAPRHLQRRLVQRLHLHVDGRRAAN